MSATEQTPVAGELRRWRQRRRLSQLELALRAGTTQRHLSFVEQGRSRPGRTLVVRLAEALELTLRERNALLLTAAPPQSLRLAACQAALMCRSRKGV